MNEGNTTLNRIEDVYREVVEKTGENLRHDPRLGLLFVARAVPRLKRPGQGCSVLATGELLTSGPKAEAVKAQFPWARGVMAVEVSELKTHLP